MKIVIHIPKLEFSLVLIDEWDMLDKHISAGHAVKDNLSNTSESALSVRIC